MALPNPCGIPPRPVVNYDTSATGHEKLAEFMTEHPQLAIFHRFEFLSNLDLLYMQAELVEQEEELRECLKEDREALDPKMRYCSRDWARLSTSKDSRTWKSVLRTRKLLKEYQKTIGLRRQIQNADSPDPADLEILQDWLIHPKGGCRSLMGHDRDIWDQSSIESLIPLKKAKHSDPLTKWALHRIASWWQFVRQPRDLEAQLVEYDDKHFERTANVIGSFLSTAILIGSIVTLNYISSMAMRFVAIALFTQIFSLVLVLVVGARKMDMFAGTAAFAAVQVVFVGGAQVVLAGNTSN